MTTNSDSIFRASTRAFFVSLSAMVGFLIAIFLLALLYSLLTSESELEKKYKVQILPGPDGKRKVLQSSSPIILQLDITGIVGTSGLDTSSIHELLAESREGDLKDDRVKAVLLNINSPGGVVVDADGIYRALVEYKKRFKVPVYAYIDGLGASGAYYIALASDKIYASEVGLVGSVGVIISTAFNLTDLLEKVGVKSLTLFQGKGKMN